VLALLAVVPLSAVTHAKAQTQQNGIFADGFEDAASCPTGRQTTATVGWRYDGAGRHNVDVTSADSVYGRDAWSEQPGAFPWNQQFSIIWNLKRAGYVSMAFVPPAAAHPTTYVLWRKTETIPGPRQDASVSTRCGDFNPPDAFCKASDVLAGGSLSAMKLPEFPGPAFCQLEPGRTYYLNLRISDPAVIDFDCGPQTCQVGSMVNHSLPGDMMRALAMCGRGDPALEYLCEADR
jgi:hypothetical protein